MRSRSRKPWWVTKLLLTFRSAEVNDSIGFQLVDLSSLMKKNEADLCAVRWTMHEKNLVSVTYLLVAAMGVEPLSIRKRLGYSEALRRLSKNDEVTV